jgi:2-amino-4-hydroxy-6-hydroxymethyldihydropteridine diphosphokinase
MRSQEKHCALLSLGSNVGDRFLHLQKAMDHLKERAVVRAVSSVYETAPIGLTHQRDFLNLAIELETNLSPHALLAALLHIEKQLGRQRREKWGPRTIDIDIIFYDDLILQEDGLSIPHAHYAERSFVLIPLAEIAGDTICPVRKISVEQIAKDLKGPQLVRKLTEHIPRTKLENTPIH